MNIKPLLLTLFILISFTGISSLGRFYMTEPLRRGAEFEMFLTVRNPTNEDLDDVNVNLYIYGLGIKLTSNNFDINDHDHELAYINWLVPKNIKKGTYLTKISVGNDYYRDVQHVYLTVI